MTIYSCRDPFKIYRYKHTQPNRQFDCLNLENFRRGFETELEPAASSRNCVLLVHGRASNPKGLRGFFSRLEAGLQSPLWDTRAFTWPSRRRLSRYSIAREVSYQARHSLRNVIQHLHSDVGYEKIILLGHSLGGNVINSINERDKLSQPGGVSGVILYSPDILVPQWAPFENIPTYCYVLATDASLKLANRNGRKFRRVGRVGVPRPSLDSVKQINTSDVTGLSKPTHDTYTYDGELMLHTRGLIAAKMV